MRSSGQYLLTFSLKCLWGLGILGFGTHNPRKAEGSQMRLRAGAEIEGGGGGKRYLSRCYYVSVCIAFTAILPARDLTVEETDI